MTEEGKQEQKGNKNRKKKLLSCISLRRRSQTGSNRDGDCGSSHILTPSFPGSHGEHAPSPSTHTYAPAHPGSPSTAPPASYLLACYLGALCFRLPAHAPLSSLISGLPNPLRSALPRSTLLPAQPPSASVAIATRAHALRPHQVPPAR